MIRVFSLIALQPFQVLFWYFVWKRFLSSITDRSFISAPYTAQLADMPHFYQLMLANV